jgi:type II secretory pathway pseudopilin PulG
MARRLFFAANGASPTIAAQVKVATGTSIKTLLQVATPSTTEIEVIEWGISCDGSAAATPGAVELLQTDVAATSGTSLTPTLWGDPYAVASLCVGGTGATCFSPSAEGTITAVRILDVQLVAPTNQYVKQFPLGREPEIPISKFLRVRVTFGTTANAYCYIIWEE